MAELLTDSEVAEALQTCADEPIHIPGRVQPFGCLLAFDAKTEVCAYASANSAAFFELEPDALLGQEVQSVLPREVWHAVKNALATGDSSQRNAQVGTLDLPGGLATAHVFTSKDHIIVEFEPYQDAGLSGSDALKTLSFLIRSIEACTSEQALFDVTVRTIKMLSGYDRVMIYRFDHEWNGEVLAEEVRRGLDPFVGLRFPHWDIPAQARDMMARFPLRFISDVDQTPVALLPAGAPPLDISLAVSRGVSDVHMEYLRNMGTAATMTVTLKVGGALWGILSFHALRPKVPSADLREILASFADVFSAKLEVLQQAARLDLVARVDALKDDISERVETDQAFGTFAAAMMEIMGVDGMALMTKGRLQLAGTSPAEPMLEALKAEAEGLDDTLVIENLAGRFPALENAANGCAGAMVTCSDNERTLLLFRQERMRDVSWAGNPGKTIEDHDGRARLAPRGSFSTYLEAVKGYSAPWTELDQYFITRIWTLVNLVERRELLNSIGRQQKIMIDELNHRVRNILALVRSVSQQALRSSYGSIESYSRSLEARISALAASHDLASGTDVAAVPVGDLIAQEFAPFQRDENVRYVLVGSGGALRAELAPIFALVIHELVTNSVKYGALVNENGRVTITLTDTDAGLEVAWVETGGPSVVAPDEFGFGATLIQQAIPHELDGDAELHFEPNGVRARLFLPAKCFDLSDPSPADLVTKDLAAAITEPPDFSGLSCLLVEDNFVIAQGMVHQLEEMGLMDVELASSVDAALEAIDIARPDFGILDINLGGGMTSEPVAERLIELGVPFFFVTGYGDNAAFEGQYRNITRVLKPATTAELAKAISAITTKPSETPK